MTVANPYFIHLELFWPDGTRPNQNEIARVNAYDVNGGVVTWEGQCGYDPNTGGWQDVIMQNIGAFESRLHPNLRFEVENTANQLVHTTQVFSAIKSGSTVKIVIGQSDELLDGPFQLSYRIPVELELSDVAIQVDGSTANLQSNVDVTKGVAGGFGNLVNAAAQQTFLGNDNEIGSVWSVGSVNVNLNSHVYGDIKSEGSVTTQSGVSVEGQIEQNTTVTLKTIFEVISLPQQLTGYEEVTTAESQGDGANRGEVHIRGGGSLTLTAGYHYFDKLRLASDGTLRIDASAGPVNIIVHTQWEWFGTLEFVAGDARSVRFIYLGYSAVYLQKECRGTIVAPNAEIYFQTPTGFKGAVFAKGVDIQGMTFEHVPFPGWDDVVPPSGDRRVFGTITNDLGLPVSGVVVEARHLAWTDVGLEEVVLGTVASDSAGDYEILYDAPTGGGDPVECGGAADAVNILVTARDGIVSMPGATLAQSAPQSAAPVELDVNLVVEKAATAIDSEFDLLLGQVAGCFGSNDADRLATMQQLSDRPELLTFVSQTSGVSEQQLQALIQAELIAAQINSDIQWGLSSANGGDDRWVGYTSVEPQVIYGLIRQGHGSTLVQLVQVTPSVFFEAMVDAVDQGFVAGVLESRLPFDADNSLQKQWSVVVAHYLGAGEVTDEARLIALAISDVGKRNDVVAAYFTFDGTFADFLESLSESVITPAEAEDLKFVFDVYSRVNGHIPTVQLIYSKKGPRAWTHVDDLAGVTLTAVGSVAGWSEIAIELTTAGGFPGDVPGATPSEKAAVYGQRLFDIFGAGAPQDRFTEGANQAAQTSGDPDAQAVVAFLQGTTASDPAAPTFDIRNDSVEEFLEENADYLDTTGINLNDDQQALLEEWQRLYSLSSDFDEVAALSGAGYGSAVEIAQVPEDEFIAEQEEALGGLAQARAVHRAAAYHTTLLYSTVVRLNQDVNDGGGSTAYPNGASLVTALQEDGEVRKLANWSTLFNSLLSCSSRHCQTVLSPSAYLVDLLEYLGDSKDTLFARRADLQDLELTCANTEKVLPYIDLVIEALGAVLSPHVVTGFSVTQMQAAVDPSDTTGAAATVLQTLANAGYLFTERALLKNSSVSGEWVLEDDSWRFTFRSPSGGSAVSAYGAPQTSETAEMLDVFPEHHNEGANQQLKDAVFPFNLPLALGREEMDLILEQRNTSREVILRVFRTGLDPVAFTYSQLGPVDDPRVARAYLHLTKSEVDAVLSQEKGEHEYWGFTSGTDDFTIPRPDNANLSIRGTWLELMSEMSVFLHRSGLSYKEMLELLDTEYIHGGSPITIFAGGEELQECNYYRFRLGRLNDSSFVDMTNEDLQRISFFLRLRRLLGWDTYSVDRYLMEVRGGQAPTSTEELVAESLVLRVVEGLKLKPEEVFPFFTDAFTIRRTDRHPRCFFDEVYLRGPKESEEYIALDALAKGAPPIVIDDNNRDGFKAHLRAALRLKSSDLEFLWNIYVGTPGSEAIAMPPLLPLYRQAKFSRALGISVEEFYAARDLLGFSVFSGVPLPDNALATLKAIEQIQKVNESSLSFRELNYLLRHELAAGQNLEPTASEFEDVVAGLAGAAGDLAARYPRRERASRDDIAALVGELVPEDKIETVLGELFAGRIVPQTADEPNYPPIVSPNEVLDRYLGGLGLDLTFDAAVEQARSLEIYERLRAVLLGRGQEEAVIAIASESSGESADAVDSLLRSSLTSLRDSSNPALVDWADGLGGWRNTSGSRVEVLAALAADTWTTQWVASADGEFTFEAIVADSTALGEAQFELVLDQATEDELVLVPTLNGQRIVFTSVSAKGGSVREISFSYSGVSQVTLLVRAGNEVAALPSPASLSAFDPRALVKLQKALSFIAGLRLTSNEQAYLRHHEQDPTKKILDAFPVDSAGSALAWSVVEEFLDLLRLNRSVNLDGTNLFDEWRALATAADPATTVFGAPDALAQIAALTGWSEAELSALLSTLWSGPPSFAKPDTWGVFHDAFHILRKIELPVSAVVSSLLLDEPRSSDAAKLRNALRTKVSDKTWSSTFKPLRDKLRQKHRDALVGLMTSKPVDIGPMETKSFVDANDLYSYFLIDVEMEPDVQLSRVKLALNSIQLFVMRVFMGLESAEDLETLEPKKAQWEWMQAYRVWEANRKVFLWPENWIEPELRDEKTELFKELEDALLQEEVNDQRAQLILAGYVEGLDELAHLQVVSAYTDRACPDVLHIIGRTRARSYTYYHRTLEKPRHIYPKFSPWKKIPLEIDAPSVAVVTVEGSLRIVWPVARIKEQKNGEEDSTSVLEIRLMWSTLDSTTKRWSKPRLGEARVFDRDIPKAENRSAFDEDSPQLREYHLRAFDEGSGKVKIQVLKSTVTFVVVQNAQSYAHSRHLSLVGVIGIDRADEDYRDGTTTTVRFGANAPRGAYFQYNGARQTADLVDGAYSGPQFSFEGFQFFSARPIEARFRTITANFSYLQPEPGFENPTEPFFYELTDRYHFYGIHRGRVPFAHITGLKAVHRAKFATFNHPQLPEIRRRLQRRGPGGIMNRLTQALPTAGGYYYYNYSANHLSSVAGGYNNCYTGGDDDEPGGIYLGYHIAGDTQAEGVAARLFEEEFDPWYVSVEGPHPLPTVEFLYGTPFGTYNWELFFHLPMLIGARLSQEMRFEEAMKWYHYVFDPRRGLEAYEKPRRFVDELPEGARYWNFLPFFANKDVKDSLLDTFGVTKSLNWRERNDLARVIDDWRNDPFSPHLIARSRTAAYQKFTVMKYLDNLIAWGDELFRRDSFESINQATQLYVLAAEILGKRPEVIEKLTNDPRYTYRELAAKGISDFSNALVALETLLVVGASDVEGSTLPPQHPGSETTARTALASLYFQIPRNEKLEGYWDTVADRLFKIRNSMNIEGIKRTLALFQPPIDPALLVRARAAGLDLSSVLAQLNAPLPHYRYSVWSAKAMDLANELKSFSASLLAALEKKDAEDLALLRQTHEVALLKLVRKVRKEQIDEAEKNIEGLLASKEIAEARVADLKGREKVSRTEKVGIDFNTAAGVLDTTSGILRAIGGGLALVPETTVKVGPPEVTWGGNNLRNLMDGIASAVGAAGTVARTKSSNSATTAGHERRQEDWDMQIEQGELEIAQIEEQIIAAEIRRDIANQELENHEKQMEQSAEVYDFLRDKFTHTQLYQWMITQLSRTYRQFNKLAMDAARTAERCFQFELGINDQSFVKVDGYRDSLRQGLLSGEQLAHDLKRMDLAYLQKDKREFEITKQISLASLNPSALQDLREKGACEISLPEILFDLDFPGQYFRRIQAMRVTIPCVTGPYTSVSAKLSLLSSAIRTESTADVNDYPYKGIEDSRFVHDQRPIQSIATSTAQDDAGLFELNFRDERYLPFEGAGAVSRWRIELPDPKIARQFDYHTISDVVLSMSYTARDAGGSLKVGVEAAITEQLNKLLELYSETETGLVRVFSMKREFPDALHRLLTAPDGNTEVRLDIRPEHFPFLLRDKEYTISPLDSSNLLHARIVVGVDNNVSTAALQFKLNDGSLSDSVSPGMTNEDGVATLDLPRGADDYFSGPNDSEGWTLTQTGLTPNKVDDILFEVAYTIG